MLQVSLLKFLTKSGMGSRRKMADAVKQGRVKVNGVSVEDFSYQVNPEQVIISIDGKEISRTQSDDICLMLNKPAGVITTTRDEKGRRHVLDLIPTQYKATRLYPVGRLDKNSTGLLLLTNNGDLTYQLTHPRYEHEKEYRVTINRSLEARDKLKLESGIRLSDGITWPAKVRQIRGKYAFTYNVVIHEGRKHQVRRMFESLGYRVLMLQRTRINNLRLGKLAEGEVRQLTTQEMDELLIIERD